MVVSLESRGARSMVRPWKELCTESTTTAEVFFHFGFAIG